VKNGATGAKGKKPSKTREHTTALSKLARAERKAERKVAELRALLVKAEKKVAKHAARAAALVNGAITKPEATVESPPVPVAMETSAAEADAAPASIPYKGERETPPSAPTPKRQAARPVKSGTAPAPSAKRTTPNHAARKGNQIGTSAPTEKEGGDE
jgi:hypothetical protein